VEWQPDAGDGWVRDAERWISQIKGVLQCKIDLDSEGEISGVHVVARHDRDPRHIVRDVEGLLKARLGITVFYKKIGVVQVVESDEPEATPAREPAPAGAPSAKEHETAAGNVAFRALPSPADDDEDTGGGDDVDAGEEPRDAVLLSEEAAPRLVCTGVGVMSTESVVRAEVQLRVGATEARGTAEGPNRSASDLALVARATLDAVQHLLHDAVALSLAEVRVDPLGGQNVVLTAVELVEGRRTERLFGTCQPHQNLHQAVVFAVLDALNRRLALMAFKSGDGAD